LVGRGTADPQARSGHCFVPGLPQDACAPPPALAARYAAASIAALPSLGQATLFLEQDTRSWRPGLAAHLSRWVDSLGMTPIMSRVSEAIAKPLQRVEKVPLLNYSRLLIIARLNRRRGWIRAIGNHEGRLFERAARFYAVEQVV
jgi:hypothetical protein